MSKWVHAFTSWEITSQVPVWIEQPSYKQLRSYKYNSRYVWIPVPTVLNIIMKKFKVHGTVRNFPGCGRERNNAKRLKKEEIEEKELWSTAKEIQTDLQIRATKVLTISVTLNNRGSKKDPTVVHQNTLQQAKVFLGKWFLDRQDQIRAFW